MNLIPGPHGWSRHVPYYRLIAAIGLGFVFSSSAPGDITYALQFDPASSAEAQQVANSVAVAAAFYNQHGSFNKHWNVHYNPGIPTAEGNYSGYMGYGGTRNERVVFHEAAHTFGMGTHATYPGLVSGGWKGKYGNTALAESYGGVALSGDGHAIWPGGFNFNNEDGFLERFYHTRVMAGIRADMGILSFTREARNEAVIAGETAEFGVESPMAATWQWRRNGVNLVNGGDISGANSATLRIANAEAADAGTYTCTVTGAGETLTNRPRQLWVHPAYEIARYNLNGNASDTAAAYHGTATGSPGYVAGKVGQAVDLDGSDDFIDLPDAIGHTRDLTIATWVNWDGGADWQRVFDFGTGTNQCLFLTPKAGGAGMRLAIKDAINNRNVEFAVNAPALAIGQWVHLAAVLRGSHMTLYVNGKPVGSNFGIRSSPADFPATNNYIGKSQFPDPLFNGRVDEFRIFGTALDGSEVWSLWGQSSNRAPVFSTDPITLPDASVLASYPAHTIAPYATDADGDTLTFAKLHGPAWLSLAADGSISGKPGPGDSGENVFVVRVTDPSGASSVATLTIHAFAPEAAPVTASITTPTTDGDDAYYFPGSIGEPNTIDGTTTSGSNDASTYVGEDRVSKGQTFATGANPLGYFLQSFTVQHVSWPVFTANGTYYEIQSGDQWELEIGTISGTTKTPIMSYSARYDGAAITGAGDSGTGRFLTFNLTGLGVQLPASTTCYFEIAPLSGDPYFELNSSRTGTYAGGTAFRGTTTGTIGTIGTIGTGGNLLTGDYAFHAKLDAKSDGEASTVGYWNFEEGAADTHVPYERTAAGKYQGSIFDRSGNANHLSVWSTNWHWYRNLVPAAATPQTGAPNTLSLQNAGSFPAVSTTGTSLNNWSPTAWTIEAAIRPGDATNGFQTFIGRDSQGAFAGEPALAALYFSVLPTGGLRILFIDAAGNRWLVDSAANTIQDGKWHAVAATSDGNTLSLYRKNLSNGDPDYALVGAVDISSSSDPALSTGAGDGTNWDPGDFTLARGLHNGTHTDRFFGHLDDIRISEGALAPTAFLHTTPLTPAESWRMVHFGTKANAGDAADHEDPDRDLVNNLLERAFGGDPNVADPAILPEIDDSAPMLSIVYRKSLAATDLSFEIQESDDLNSPWVPAAGSETTVSDGTIRFTRPPGTADRLFLRLKVTGF